MKQDSPDNLGSSANETEYRRQFVRRSHELLLLGYRHLNPREQASEEEETITGRLLAGMERVCDDPPAEIEEWVDFYHAKEEVRVHSDTRTGKRRKRVDIRVDSAVCRPRNRFSFEAKRLGPGHGVAAYLGDEGLGCFIYGEYGRDADDGGMIGYVQAGSESTWATRITDGVAARAAELQALEAVASLNLVDSFAFTLHSCHARPQVGRAIEVFHTLLRCH